MAAAVRLEMAADAMRRTFTASPEESAEFRAFAAEIGADLGDPFDQLAADTVTAVQLGTVEPPLTAQEFADAVAAVTEVAESGTPAPGESLPPASPAPAPYPTDSRGRPIEDGVNGWIDPEPVFSSERRRVLDWRPRHDPESRRYGIRERLRGSTPVQDVLLPSDWPTLDQGSEGACTGAGVAAAWNTTHPGETPLDMAAALDLFRLAERLDEFPGEGLGGSSVLGAMEAGVQRGLFGGYLWSFGTRDIAQTILAKKRPVVIGIPWTDRMYETGPGGLVQLGGAEVGGHCLAVVGISRKGPQGQDGPFFAWHNSWGDSYGDGGIGWIHHRDLAALLRGRGEAAVPTAEAQEPTP
jgi:hypothetical protein